MDMLFDIVIPLGPNDVSQIQGVINHARNNILNYRNIYIVSYNKNIFVDNVITIDQNIFPFTKCIENYLGKNDRNGWYLQQLIKLYAGHYIPDILKNYLIIDADTYFLKTVEFFKHNLPLYNYGTECHSDYFRHMSLLHPSLKKYNNTSGICHHMLFQKDKLNHLFEMVEKYHDNKKSFWIIFLECIEKPLPGSGASEYEIYYNFLHIYYPNEFIIRPLKWNNTSINDEYDYVSYHWYIR